MKKTLLLILTLLFSLLLTSCARFDEESKSNEWKYDESYHWKEYTFGIIIHTNKNHHIDEESSNDGICDICGYNMIESHTNHEWNYIPDGENGHFKNYTCGCPSEEGTTSHYDENEDNLCDACGYELSANLDDNTFSFEELSDISNQINIDKIKKIKFDYSNDTIAILTMNKVTEIVNRDQLTSVSNFIKNTKFTLATDSYDGVGTYKITLYDENGSFEFYLSSRYEYYFNGICYISSLNFPINLKMLDVNYMYFDSSRDIKLSSYDNISSLEDFDISEIHFLPAQITFFAYDYTKDADLIIDGIKYRIISPELICDEYWVFYEVVSDKNFEDLLPKDEERFVVTIINDNIQDKILIAVSYNVVYTYEEIENIVIKLTNNTNFTILNSDRTTFIDRAFIPDDCLILKYNS